MKREGHGKGNWGSDKMVYKKKGETAEDVIEEVVAEVKEGEYQEEENKEGGERYPRKDYGERRDYGQRKDYGERREYG